MRGRERSPCVNEEDPEVQTASSRMRTEKHGYHKRWDMGSGQTEPNRTELETKRDRID